ncbi:hypothetical protein K3495_g13616 [Podosphaera aphanis]|nr:hypothetical protein K3495_g13616 [Podosphaera aphanis]
MERYELANSLESFQEILDDYHSKEMTLDRIKNDYRDHVRQVVSRLKDAGLQIHINKCEFETNRTKYLGLTITSEGIEMDPKIINVITSWEPPKSIKDLQRFLGFANFYRRFIQNFSMITQPLNSLLKKEPTWNWTNDQQRAFQNLKSAFTTAPTLAFFNHERKTILGTDASDWASEGVLSQYGNDSVLRPLLAIVKCLEEWRPELQGTQEPFEILTDHKNLEYFMTTKALNQRQVRWSEFLSHFNFRIAYRPGAKAIRPDALSRESEDRPPNGWDINDDRIKNREQIILKKTNLMLKLSRV